MKWTSPRQSRELSVRCVIPYNADLAGVHQRRLGAGWREFSIKSIALVLLVGVGFAGSVGAHEYVEGKGVFVWNPKRGTHLPSDPALRSGGSMFENPANVIAPQYVVVLPNRWAIGQTLRVCFYGGSDSIRAKIVGSAKAWLTYANLKFDTGGPSGQTCKQVDDSEIRIGFKEPGYWSYIGTDGVTDDLVSKGLPSLNLQGFDTSPPVEPRFSGIVLHEFGHALGFHHEHQSPGEGCDQEYDWPKLYAFYKTTYGWEKAEVDDNVRQLVADHRAYDWSKPDPASIMVYASDPQFLKKGTASPCYFHENYKLSTVDKAGATKTYNFVGTHEILLRQSSDLQLLLPRASSAIAPILKKQLELTQQQIQATQ